VNDKKMRIDQDLDGIQLAIQHIIEKETDKPINRICAFWAYFGADILNNHTGTSDYEPVFGSMEICVNNPVKSDPSEGWYWGYMHNLPDSRPDEFHGWIVNRKKGELIDFTSGFIKDNFLKIQDHLDESYIWDRADIPDPLFIRNFTYRKINNQHGLRYTEDAEFTRWILSGKSHILSGI